MPILQAYTMNLECVSMFYVIFAEATGVSSISSKIGSLNKKNQEKKKEKKAKIKNYPEEYMKHKKKNILFGKQTHGTV